EGIRSKGVFWLGMAALVLAVPGGVLMIISGAPLWLLLALSGAVGDVAIVLYGADIRQLYRTRKRRAIELTSQMAACAVSCLFAALALSIVLIGLGLFTHHIGAVVFLLGFGWLSGLGLAKLYKIVAFLTWLECYGPV